ncbi:hypothetical protein F1880_001494 [Penicillium rolfsii]|nr:hypothetical protein F1880_001494 [Penicillium rolfsii]
MQVSLSTSHRFGPREENTIPPDCGGAPAWPNREGAFMKTPLNVFFDHFSVMVSQLGTIGTIALVRVELLGRRCQLIIDL